MKRTIFLILGALIIAGGITSYILLNKESTDTKDSSAQTTSTTEAVATEDTTSEQVTSQPEASNEGEATQGRYITLADYESNKTAYADTTQVYFFHASWCSICQGIENEIKDDPSRIPAGVTLIKTDFDSSTSLRQKYGITVQYTFVQVDSNGNQLNKWSATNLDAVLKGIEA